MDAAPLRYVNSRLPIHCRWERSIAQLRPAAQTTNQECGILCGRTSIAHDALCRRVRRPACDRRLGAIARQTVLERVANAEREAGPDRHAEIQRHPGNLVLPLRKVVGHDPARADVTQTLQRLRALAAGLGPP